jgi:hypothetical protein
MPSQPDSLKEGVIARFHMHFGENVLGYEAGGRVFVHRMVVPAQVHDRIKEFVKGRVVRTR